jgi:hypothetical protein
MMTGHGHAPPRRRTTTTTTPQVKFNLAVDAIFSGQGLALDEEAVEAEFELRAGQMRVRASCDRGSVRKCVCVWQRVRVRQQVRQQVRHVPLRSHLWPFTGTAPNRTGRGPNPAAV